MNVLHGVLPLAVTPLPPSFSDAYLEEKLPCGEPIAADVPPGDPKPLFAEFFMDDLVLWVGRPK